jgi:hypothetical protein
MLTSPATVNFELLNTTAAVLAQVSLAAAHQRRRRNQHLRRQQLAAAAQRRIFRLWAADGSSAPVTAAASPTSMRCGPLCWLFQVMQQHTHCSNTISGMGGSQHSCIWWSPACWLTQCHVLSQVSEEISFEAKEQFAKVD